MEESNEVDLPVLVPRELIDEYKDYMNEDLRTVLRATTLRRYLEGIVNLFFKEKVKEENKLSNAEWGKDNLNSNINAIKDYYDEEIGKKLHQVRNIGNIGSHIGNDAPSQEVDRTEINTTCARCQCSISS